MNGFKNILSASVYGINGHLVHVEVDISSGLPHLSIIGLPDATVREARDRVISAIKNSGYQFPTKKIIVNLAPAEIRKEGSAFDLPIAIGILAASGKIKTKSLEEWCFIGELALDGQLRAVRGILPIAMELSAQKIKKLILPFSNLKEAAIVQSIDSIGIHSLKELIQLLEQEFIPLSKEPLHFSPYQEDPLNSLDFADVKGQKFAKRALEITAAGAHNLLLIGPPGSGKTMLSKRIVTILPPLSLEEAIETTKIHSVIGLFSSKKGLMRMRPFRNPHHTISDIALIGGGQNPKPGEISLAHNVVLFLDELPEFERHVLEVLRQPLESREVVIARSKDTITYPANFMLIAAMNPCPCGFLGHPLHECVCTPYQIQKYMAKISGPLLDRIDLFLEVPCLKIEEYEEENTEPSQTICKRVMAAKEQQKKRFQKENIHSNAEMNAKQIKKFCKCTPEAKSLLKNATEKLRFSARAYDRILKVAKTLSDMLNQEEIEATHIAEALQYRSLDRINYLN